MGQKEFYGFEFLLLTELHPAQTAEGSIKSYSLVNYCVCTFLVMEYAAVLAGEKLKPKLSVPDKRLLTEILTRL